LRVQNSQKLFAEIKTDGVVKSCIFIIDHQNTKNFFLYLRLLRVLRGKNIAVRSM